MRTGKLPEEILVRSVLEKIGHRRNEVLFGPAVGADCAALKTSPEEILLFSADPITGAVQGIGGHSIHVTANDLAAAGAEPVAVLLTVLLPPEVTEEEVEEMICSAEEVCRDLHIEILGGHTEITPVVSQPVISVTGIGKCAEKNLLRAESIKPGMDIVISKWTGLEATAILAAERRDHLEKTLPAETIDAAAAFREYLSVVPEAAAAVKAGAVWMHDITEGGILGALWETAEAGRTGLDIDLESIPVRAETEAVCAAFSVDPLRIMSSGSLLMVAADGEKIVKALEEQGIFSAVIGKTTAGGRRILRRGEAAADLTPPEPDALYTALASTVRDPEKK